MIGLPAALVALVALAAGGATQEGPPLFGVDVEVVRVEVLVTHDGEPVRGLTAGDFELRDEGVPQRLNPITFEEAPVDAFLVLDLSGSVMGSKLEALRDAARAFLADLSPADRAALVGFQHTVTAALPLTSDLSRVRFALEAVEGGGSTALHDAVYVALRLSDPGRRRKAIVVFSDGIDNVSWLSGEDVVRAAARSEAVVYGVDARGPGDPDHRFLKDVARATGGRVWRTEKIHELRGRFLDVLQDIRSRYVLSYTPRGVDAAGWHQIEVKLRGVQGEVLARPAYFRPPRDTR